MKEQNEEWDDITNHDHERSMAPMKRKRQTLVALLLLLSANTIVNQSFDRGEYLDGFTQRSSINKSESKTIPTISKYNRTLTLLVFLRGELGNHLSILANAHLIQRFVERELPGIRLELKGVHQSAPWWESARDDLRSCFPHLKQLDFESGTWDSKEFLPVQRKRVNWLGKNGTSLLRDVSTPEQIQYIKELLDQQARGGVDDRNIPPIESRGDKYSMPYLTAQRFVEPTTDILMQVQNYRIVRSFFEFDTLSPLCCEARAEPGESVLHFRNFAAEIQNPQKQLERGFIELSETETAQVLFHKKNWLMKPKKSTIDHPSTKKVAIISRFVVSGANKYAVALQRYAGWDARVVEDQTGVQDFCLAMSTSSSLVGVAKSTYAIWAGILGNASLNRWYSVTNTRISSSASLQQKGVQTHTVENREFRMEFYSYETNG